jgi:hypothetical protein
MINQCDFLICTYATAKTISHAHENFLKAKYIYIYIYIYARLCCARVYVPHACILHIYSFRTNTTWQYFSPN